MRIFHYRSRFAFTLIELLIVLVIIAILIAIAAPSFLNQQTKAQNSAAYQELAVAYKDAKSDMASNTLTTGAFPSYTSLASDIASDEPEYSVGTAVFSSDTAVVSGSFLKVWVLSGGTGTPTTIGNNLFLADVSKSGQVCTLSVTGDGPPVYGGCGSTGGGSAGVAVVANITGTGSPVVSGSASVSSTNLSVGQGSWSTTPSSYAYQWQRCTSSGANCVSIGGAMSASYTPVVADDGDVLQAEVTATDSGGHTATQSAQTGVVTAYPSSSVVAFYNLNEANTSVPVTDNSGNGNTGSYYTSASGITIDSTDEKGNAGAAAFNGSGNLIDLGDAADMQLTQGTYAIWAKTTAASSSSGAGLIVQRYAQVIEILNGKAIGFDSGSQTVLNSGVTVNDGAWHQIVLTFTSGQECLYVDGTNQICGPLAQQSLGSSVVLGAGDLSQGFQPFTGTLAHPLVLSTVLSAQQVQSLYNQG